MDWVHGRARTHPQNRFLLKTDVIQESRGWMDFSKEDGVY